MSKRPTEPQSLQLTTLSGTYEAARAVVRVTTIETASTFDRLAMRMKHLASPRGREDLITLFNALNKLDEASHVLGQTTLVAPLDHPLVTHHEMPFVKKGK